MTKYNFINKKEPMERALGELKATAWLAGLRHSQSEDRQDRSFAEWQGEILKVYPILDWDDRKTYQYIPDHDLPYHPSRAWAMIRSGDHHSTEKVSDSGSKEDSRHGGHGREVRFAR